MDQIFRDRRANRRYALALPVRYRISRGKDRQVGVGSTRDVSTGGVSFIADEELPVGQAIEVWMKWPVQTGDGSSLELHILGSVVRREGTVTGIRIRRHEFMTAAENRVADQKSSSADAQGWNAEHDDNSVDC
jgi:hypothetical protein